MSAFNAAIAARWDQIFGGVSPTPQGSKVVMVQGSGQWGGSGQDSGQSNSCARGSRKAHILNSAGRSSSTCY